MKQSDIDSDDPIELSISDLSRGGSGVAKDAEGRIVFVPLTAPGDRVRAKIIFRKKNFAEAKLLELLEPSPVRVAPKCPVFGKCGGCQWQHLPYELQWKTKSNGVKHALERVQLSPSHSNSHLVQDFPIDEFPAQAPWGYRNRVQLRGEKGKLGYFAPKSHELISIDTCPIARLEINEDIPKAKLQGSSRNEPYKVEIEVFPDGQVLRSWNRPHAAEGFRQVNDEQNGKMKSWIRQNIPGQEVLYDLYGGSGNLSIALSERYEEVHCVDVSSPAQSPPGTPGHFHFHRSAVLPWLKRVRKKSALKAYESATAIVDPPRMGIYQDVAEISDSLKELNVKNLIAVGCDPDSWARDLARWTRHGWKLQKVAVFDFFPQTPHIESVASLQLD